MITQNNKNLKTVAFEPRKKVFIINKGKKHDWMADEILELLDKERYWIKEEKTRLPIRSGTNNFKANSEEKYETLTFLENVKNWKNYKIIATSTKIKNQRTNRSRNQNIFNPVTRQKWKYYIADKTKTKTV